MSKSSYAVLFALVQLPICFGGSRSFVNWETPHVHPLELTPDGMHLLAVNTPDNRLEVFELSTGFPRLAGSVPVGLDPVSVRARNNDEAWVVNHVSDSISIVDLRTMNVVRTIRTDDEPADVVFGGTRVRAFVSCSQPSVLLVVDLDHLDAEIRDFNRIDPNDTRIYTLRLPVVGEEPRALAVSADGARVYVAMFESGNQTTILAGGDPSGQPPPNVVNDRLSPYFDSVEAYEPGVNPRNPPLNDLSTQSFRPAMSPSLPPAPRTGLIVRRKSFGSWLDDNGMDWAHLVDGAFAEHSGRQPGWTLLDHDLGVLNADDLSIQYFGGMMNLCMAVAVQPRVGRVTVVGTEATNEIRFEPVLQGRFLRVNHASIHPLRPTNPAVVTDLNPHLEYTNEIPLERIPPAARRLAIGDPRAIVWRSDGLRGYVAGMGSNNVVAIDASAVRAIPEPLDVGEGPTGLALDEARQRLYVLNKFESSISVVDTIKFREVLPRIPFFDPSPTAIKIGRKHLYNTHDTSGLGHLSCASCHVDARTDRLAWDLGNPAGEIKPFEGNCDARNNITCAPWHPMKGPMTTQTLQDIIGREPHHWRGDRRGLEEFADAFEGLMGADEPLSAAKMQEFEDFLATIHFPPNPFRNIDNSLPQDLPLVGHYATGQYATEGGLPAGYPMPNGDAQRGLARFRGTPDEDGLSCARCHTFPSGLGPDGVFAFGRFQPRPVGPDGEHHHMVGSMDGFTNRSMKIPQLRSVYEKVGFDLSRLENTAGFGFGHDGSFDSVARFIGRFIDVRDDQDLADVIAFVLSFSGGDLPPGDPLEPFRLPGSDSLHSHAAVGRQLTLPTSAENATSAAGLLSELIALANTGQVGLVAKGLYGGAHRGYAYVGMGIFQADYALEQISVVDLASRATSGGEITFTVVPVGCEARIGVDRDEDGYLDGDETEHCGDPSDAAVVPVACPLHSDVVAPRCMIDVNDIMYILDAYADVRPCANFPGADLSPCNQPCSLVDLSDVLSSLGAYRGNYECVHTCPRWPF